MPKITKMCDLSPRLTHSMTVSPTTAPPPCCPWGLTYPLSWFQLPLYADTQVRVSSATSHLNFRIFSIPYWVSLTPKCPTGTFTPNTPTAQHTTSRHELALPPVFPQVVISPFSHLHEPNTPGIILFLFPYPSQTSDQVY